MIKKRYYFWQNIPSPHQAGHLRALAQAGHDVNLLVDALALPERVAMGWKAPDLTSVSVRIVRGASDVLRVFSAQGADAFNIVSGLRGCMTAPTVSGLCRKRHMPFAVIAEAADHTTWRLPIRLAYYHHQSRRLAQHRVLFFAMGRLGVDWYTRVGFPVRYVREFGYSVDCQDVQPPAQMGCAERPVRLVYAGALYERKRVALLLRALREVRGNWELEIIGDGLDRAQLQRLASQLGCAERLRFTGSLPHDRVLLALSRHDALVLPSRYDGWGAVVGEALCHGVRAIASDECGSSTLLADPSRGFVFRSGNVSELATKLSQVVDEGPRNIAQRSALAAWARCIQGESLAQYLDRTVDWFLSGEGEPPDVPWEKPVALPADT